MQRSQRANRSLARTAPAPWAVPRRVPALLFSTLLAALCGCTSIDTFHLGSAQLADQRYLQEFPSRQKQFAGEALGLYAHRVVPGSGLILAYRWYSPGGMFISDDEHFEKVTIWVPAERISGAREYEVSRSPISVVFSRGGSAWPRAACSGWLKSGTVRLEPRGSEMFVEVSGILDVASGQCPSEIAIDFRTRALSDFSMLTPWLGTQGAHPYEESYR